MLGHFGTLQRDCFPFGRKTLQTSVLALVATTLLRDTSTHLSSSPLRLWPIRSTCVCHDKLLPSLESSPTSYGSTLLPLELAIVLADRQTPIETPPNWTTPLPHRDMLAAMRQSRIAAVAAWLLLATALVCLAPSAEGESRFFAFFACADVMC